MHNDTEEVCNRYTPSPKQGIYSNCKLPMTDIEGSVIRDIHHLTMVHSVYYTAQADYVSGSATFWYCIFEFESTRLLTSVLGSIFAVYTSELTTLHD